MRKQLAGLAVGILIMNILGGCAADTGEEEQSGNQRYLYAVVTSIEGNEMTYVEVEESQVVSTEEESDEDKQEDVTEAQNAPEDDRQSENGDRPSGESGEKPSEEGGEKPSEESGGKPSEESGGKPSEESGGKPSEESGEKGYKDMAGDAVSVQIPVGVTVHTASGTETTFSRIASGDVLKILLETDADGDETITEIWMIDV